MQTEYVASGDYHIPNPGERKKLVALLGTCVGVVIFDRSVNIGGLCHILLPEPNDPTSVWQPKNYASTCLPLFVDELLKKGANRDRLEAVVAGGSLLAPVSNRDVFMDIGGRNTETTFSFLNRHNIPVIKSETGGFHAMNLSLETATCHTDINHIIHYESKPDTSASYSKPSKKEIDQAISNTKPIPQVALKVIRLLQEGKQNTQQIAAELINDQVLSAKIISYCNSAYFGFKTNIDSVERAALFLGEAHLLEAIISTSIKSLFEQEEIGGYALLKGGLFRHSTGVANLAKIIAQICGKEDDNTAYTAGLLHDIGKVVLDSFVSKAQPFFYHPPEEKYHDFIQLEQDYFDLDHQILGRQLAEAWGIPDNLKEVISLHHYPEKAQKHRTLTHIVYVADLLASFFMSGIELEKINQDSFDERLAVLGIAPRRIPDIVDRVPWAKLMSL